MYKSIKVVFTRLLIAVTLVSAAFSVNAASPRYVSLTGGHGTPFDISWAGAANDIQSAINVANDGDTILVRGGPYNISSPILINKPITLKSEVNAQASTISANFCGRCIVMSNKDAIIDGFTITAGMTQLKGGGVYSENGGTIKNCVITSNMVFSITDPGTNACGGGVYLGTNGLIQDCEVSSNVVSIRVFAGTNASTISACGGGLYAGVSTLVSRCYIKNNMVDVFSTYSNHSVIARGGGAFLNQAAISNSIIYTNLCIATKTNYTSGKVQAYGGGIYLAGNDSGAWGPVKHSAMENCTVVSNSAIAITFPFTSSSNIVSCEGGVGGGGVSNSIIYYNLALSFADGPTGMVANSCMTVTNAWRWTGVATYGHWFSFGNITGPPLFSDSLNGDYSLSSVSPCVNAGATQAWMQADVDLAGSARVVGGAVDLGAYESSYLPAWTVTASAIGQGSITPSGVIPVADGSNVTFTLVSSNLHHVSDITIDGSSIGASSNFTVSNVKASHFVEATFERNSASILGDVSYAGPQSGTIYINATGLFFGVTESYSDQLSATGAYSVLAVPVCGTNCNFNVQAYMDSNGNGSLDSNEPSGAYTLNPITNISSDITAVNIQLLDPIFLNTLIHYVSPAGAHSYPYTNWTDAATNIQTALTAAEDGDKVIVTNGNYALNSTVNVTKQIHLKSLSGPENTLIDGQLVTSCLYVSSNAAVDGFTITRGMNASSNALGGGVYLDNGILSNCIVTGNATLTNSGSYGGGVLCSNGVVDTCVISSNSSWTGGGICLRGGELRNSLIHDNYASHIGGGLALGASSGFARAIQNCTIVSNTAISSSTQVDAYDCLMDNCIIVGSSSFSNSLIMNNCRVDVLPGSWFLSTTNDPEFVDAEHNDWRVFSSSPCVDSGITLPLWMVAGCKDVMGNDRIYNGIPDMGAYESQGLNDYTITPSAINAGSISPNYPVRVLEGDTITFSMVPDALFVYADLMVDGASVGTPTSYTFTNISLDHTISARYERDEYSIAGDITYSRHQTGPVRIYALGFFLGTPGFITATIATPGVYSLFPVTACGTNCNFNVIAFMDVNSNGVHDTTEPYGFYTGNPVTSIFSSITSADIILIDPPPDDIEEDSDGDGLTDGWEYYKTFTSPSNPDSDNDGFSDYEEVVRYITDPNDADSLPGTDLPVSSSLDAYDPNNPAADPVPVRRPEFLWLSDLDEAWYQIKLRHKREDGSWRLYKTEWVKNVDVSGTSRIHDELSVDLASGFYKWNVRAYDSLRRKYGPWAIAHDNFEVDLDRPSGTPQISWPAGLSGAPTQIDGDDVQFSWTEVSDADSYIIRIARMTTNVWDRCHKKEYSTAVLSNNAGVVNLNSFVGLKAGSYRWKVRGKNADGSGPWSDSPEWGYFNVSTDNPGTAPVLVDPAAADAKAQRRLSYVWQRVDKASRYRVVIQKSKGGKYETYRKKWVVPKTPGIPGENYSWSPKLDLPSNASFRWRVGAARHAVKSSAISSWVYFTTYIEKPSIPVLLAPMSTNLTERRQIFSWSAVSNATMYRAIIERQKGLRWKGYTKRWFDGSDITQDGTNLFCAMTCVFKHTGTFRWRVQASNQGVKGDFTSDGSFVIDLMSFPTNQVIDQSAGDENPEFKWDEIEGAAKYYLEIRRLSKGKWKRYRTAWLDQDFEYVVQTWLANERQGFRAGQYKWRICAWNDDSWGEWSVYSAIFTVNVNRPQGVPLLMTPVFGSSSSVTMPVFTWTAVANSSGYFLLMKGAKGKIKFTQDGARVKQAWSAGTSFTPTTALKPGTYRWWVRAWNPEGFSEDGFSLPSTFTVTP